MAVLPQFHGLKEVLCHLYQPMLSIEAAAIAIVVGLALGGTTVVDLWKLSWGGYLPELVFQN